MIFWRFLRTPASILLGFSIVLAACSNGAYATDSYSGRVDLTPAQAKELKFMPPEFKQSKIRVTFKDPRQNREIEKIMFDPAFKPSRLMKDRQTTVNDFFLVTSIKRPRSKRAVSETALCDWNANKSEATCHIEDDGGRVFIGVSKRGATPAASEVYLTIKRGDGYDGFRIAGWVDSGGQNGVRLVIVRPDTVVKARIKF
jgi:hypothetical protein